MPPTARWRRLPRKPTATADVSVCDRSAVADSVPAEASSCVEADDTVWTISPITFSKLRVMPSTRRPRSILASASSRRGLVGGLLGNQRLLEHLQGVRHGADLGLLALMRHIRAQIAFAQRLHRGDDGGDATQIRREPDSS